MSFVSSLKNGHTNAGGVTVVTAWPNPLQCFPVLNIELRFIMYLTV